MHLGYMRRDSAGYVYGDGAPVARALGLKPESPSSRGGSRVRTHMNERTALRYAEILGLDPVDIGL